MSVVDTKSRKTKVNSVLISQPEPKADSPYHKLGEKFGLQLDFKKFIKIESVPFKEFRKEKVDVLAHTAVIFTSRNAVDNYFRVCQEAKIEVPTDMKYFCISEQTAHYLQKYITIRKRKLFVGKKVASDMFELFKKHTDEKYLFPCSDIRKDEIPEFLKQNGYHCTEAVLYRTVAEDLKAIKDINYDIIAFFSPSGVSSLTTNFPDFDQKGTRIAAFGPTTAKAVRDAGLHLDIEAPMPNAPSMTGALELYIKEVNI